MKKQLYFIFALLLSISSFAQTFTVDGLKYNITSTSTTEPGTVEVGDNGFVQGASPQTYFSGVASIRTTVTYNGLDYAVTGIGSNAFEGCVNLTRVEIPNSVLSIGDFAFARCTNLSSVTIPDSVTSLGSAVFQRSGLTSISIPNLITVIRESTFSGCSKLESVILPNIITSIKTRAFQLCTALTTIDLPGTLREIGPNAFTNSGLLSITIPEGIASISNVFENCNALTSVVLPASLTTVANTEFQNCPALRSVTLNNPVPIAIGLGTFDFIILNSGPLVDIDFKIPLGTYGAYSDAPVWKYLRLIEQIAVGTIFTVDGINYSVSNDTTHPREAFVSSNTSFAGAANIPEIVTFTNNAFKIVGIATGAFAGNTTLTSVSIPNSVKVIRGGFFGIPSAFENCTNLTSVTLGSGLQEIGQGAFANCTALTTVTSRLQTPLVINPTVFLNVPLANATLRVPAGKIPAYEAAPVWKDFGTIASPQVGDVFTVAGIQYAITAISPALTVAVASNTAATGAVVIPTSVTNNGDTFAVTSIAAMAFKNAAITAVTIPNSITNIATEAFANCAALRVVTTTIAVPLVITASVFTDTTISASTLNVPFGTAAAYEAAAVWTDFTIVAPIPAPIVGQIFTFEGINYFVTKATTPYEVQVFFNRNFSGVAVIPASVDYLGNSFAVKSIVNGAFDGSSLTSVTIPTSISSIRRTVFYNCRSLHTVNLPNTITTIGEEAFDSCSALQSITIPDAVTSIGYNAFTLSGITSINIPKAVTSLGFAAFSWCSSLTSITVKWDTPLAVDTALFNGLVIGNITLNVPIGTKAAYQAAEVWKDFNPIQEFAPAPVLGQTFTVNGINYVVSKATTPYEVAVGTHTGFVGAANIPATVPFAGNSFTVKSISYLAFELNGGLTAVTIPNTVTQISDEAFFGCSNLSTATIGTGVTSIGANAFGGCKLTTIDIPSSVISIGEFAFQNNATLSSVKVNWANPITIGADVFSGIALANVILYVPAGTVAVYDTVADNVWTNFNPILEPCITPTAPTAVAQSLCNGATVANLVATGTGTIKWYDVATAGTALASTTALTTGTYYASQTTTCESVSRTAVVVTINAIPTAPTATAQNFTTASTVANLVPTPSTTIKWYGAATGGTALATTTAIATGTYYVSATNANGCESARTAVEVTVNIVTAPVLNHTFTFEGINYIVIKATLPYEVAVHTNPNFTGAANIPDSAANGGNSYSVTSIGDDAFFQCFGLTSVIIPNSVTSIGEYALANCTGLTSVSIPGSVTSIGNYAFFSCYDLRSVSIPSSVTSIGEQTFAICIGLTSVNVNWATPLAINDDDVFRNVTLANVRLNVPIGTAAAYEAAAVWTDFNPIVEPCITPTAPTAVAQSLCNGATVANLVATGTGTIKWYNVATAGTALASTTALTTGTYYASQTTTCESVSRTAVDVTISAIPTAPTATAQNFTTASTVANLVPTASTTIKWYDVATGGAALGATTVIATGTYYVSETTNGCESTRTAVEVTVNTTVPPVLNDTFTFNGINYLIIKDTKPYEVVVTATPDFNGTAEIPAMVTNQGNSFAVTAIGVNAFSNATGLTGVSIPNSVIRIATNAFNNCTNLGAVVVPDSVISIGNYAFTSCTALASIEMSDALQSIGDGAFDSCTSLSTISLPATLTAIGEAAFAGCTGLTAVTVGATTPLVINADVFLSVSLGSVRLNVPAGSLAAYQAAAVWQNFSPIAEPAPPVVGESFTSNGLNYTITSATAPYTAEVANNSFFVGAAAIPATVALAGNTFAVTSIATNAFQNCNGLTAVIIPNSVTSMGIGAFERCTNLVSVSLPTSLTTISSYAFSYCERLTTINIPSSITTIEANAFRECSGLIAISLPNSITSIGHGAFQLCYNLVTVNIPNTLTRLEDYLFESCIALQSIVIPNTVTNIGAYSLKNTRLTEIIIPSSVTRIENSALAENYNLTTLNIPSSVTRIDDLAFSSCEGLRSITVNWSTPVDVVRRVFTFIPIATVVLNVPSGTRAAYAAAPVWSEFIITEPTTNVTTPPTAVAQTFCNTASVSNLVATGTNLKWYNVANAGTALLITDAVVSGTYYVSQTITGVESARTSVAITVNTTAAPTASNQTLWTTAKVAHLVAIGTNLKWYNTATGGTDLATSSSVVAGTYYVSQTIDNCESARTAIMVSTSINYCRGAVAQPLAAPFAPGTTVRWYTVATGGTALAAAPTPHTTTIGTKLWYVASVINGIESTRETITVNTVALPVAPSIITGTASVGVLVGSNTTATYSTANVVGAVSYLWTVPSGVQIEAGQGTNTVTLNFINVSNQPGTIGNISVAAVNASGCAGLTKAFSLRSAIPIAPISLRMMDQTALDPSRAITYISTFIGTNKVLTLTAAPSATASSYLWELAAGMTQLSGGNTNTITVNFAGVNTGVTSLYVGVKSVNGVGISSTANSAQNPATLSTARLLKLSATLLTATPTVTGQTTGLCGGVTYNYTTTAVALANRYQITAPTGAVVRSASNMSNNSNTLSTSDLIFTVTYPAGFVVTTALPATLEVRPANGVGTGSKSRILNLFTAMPTFKTITGSAGITTFTTTATQTFTVAEIVGATNYNWTVANGAVIVSGQGTNTITVNFAAIAVAITSTRITVVAANSCGVANTVRTLTLRKVTPPAARFAAAPIAINTTEVYPNPIVNDFNIDVIASKMGMLEMSIYTLDGVLVRKPKIVALAEGENHITENVANFPTGVYIIQLVNSSSNEVTTKKLIKQ